MTNRTTGAPVGTGDNRQAVSRLFMKRLMYIVGVCIVAIVVTGASIAFGSTNIALDLVYKSLVNQLFPGLFEVDPNIESIIIDIRAPRVLMAVGAGAGLAIGGCITQSVLRNSLATPYTLGISSSACFGAALSMIYGFALINGVYGQILNAFIFSLIPVAIILLAAGRKSMSPTTMVLCGIAVSYIASACNTIMQYFADPNAVKNVVFWSIGDLNNSMLWQTPYVFVVSIVGFILAMVLSKDLDILRMGDDTAKGLGINVGAIRGIAIVSACLLTATIVSFIGAIGFICLLAPHISRTFIGNGMKYLIPASALTGIMLLLIADIVAKTVIAPAMLPVGAITALFGGPLLIFLLVRKKTNIN
ncbi:MAG: iron ABC transporter permease [archaeon]|nr:iron ABC transporter permease [archaeon]